MKNKLSIQDLELFNKPLMLPHDFNLSHVLEHLLSASAELNTHQLISDRDKIELDITNGLCDIKIEGVLYPNSRYYGCSMLGIRDTLDLADDSGDVKSKRLLINSPGGFVTGCFETSDHIRNSSKIKPIEAFCTGSMTSGAYLLGISCDKTYITSKTNSVGSIGVVTSKADFTKYYKQIGISFDNFVTGKYKDLYSGDRETDEFVRGAIQSEIDYILGLFVSEVVECGKLSEKEIIDLEAQVLIGQQAVDFGLVDGFKEINQKPKKQTSVFSISNDTKGDFMNLETLKKEHSALYESILKIGVDSVNVDELVAVGKVDERSRIEQINGLGFAGQEECVASLIKDNSTVGDAALKLNADLKNKENLIHQKLGGSGGRKMDVELNGDNDFEENQDDENQDPKDPKTIKAKWEALTHDEKKFLGSFEVFEAAELNQGNVKVFNK